MDESEVLVRIGALLVAEAILDRALKALGRFGVVARFILLQRQLERRGSRLERAEHRPPGGVAGLRSCEFQLRGDAQRFTTFFPARPVAPGGRLDERAAPVRLRARTLGPSQIDRPLPVACRLPM